MKFELNEAQIDEIIFFMEDQCGEFYFDTVEGIVAGLEGGDFGGIDLGEDDGEGGQRYISLPEWDSSDGFRLMERFAAGLKNHVVRQQLSSALDRGRGVFRAFKDVLEQFPEAEKLWFSFKEKEMKREVINWYNALREEWGLEKIGEPPEETADLVLEDFCFRPFQQEDLAKAEELHKLCREECKTANAFFEYPPVTDLRLTDAVCAETASGEFAGFASGITVERQEPEQSAGKAFSIQNLMVKPEYRGLGVGEALLEKLLERVPSKMVKQVFFDLPSHSEGFSRVLLRESFKPYAVRYCLNLTE